MTSVHSLRCRAPTACVLGAVAAGLLACRPAQAPCRSTADCLEHEVCVEDQCRSVCNSGSDCTGGRVCVNGACSPGGGSPDRALPDAAAADSASVEAGGADRPGSDGGGSDAAAVDRAGLDGAGLDRAAAEAGSPDVASASDVLAVPDVVTAPDQGAAQDAAWPGDAQALPDAASSADSAAGPDQATAGDALGGPDQASAPDQTTGSDASPVDAVDADPCAEVSCVANASCVVVNGSPVCRCDIEQCSGGYCRSASECCDAADCGRGSWSCVVGFQCSCVAPLVVCNGECRAANACGGCAVLDATPNTACLACGTWTCADGETLECRGDHDKIRYFHDGDGDGYGSTAYQDLCAASGNYRATADGDCNDSDDTMYPLAPELCDGKDNDCAVGTSDGESCPGGKSFCCGTPLGCQTCCLDSQCGTGEQWDCAGNECSCLGLMCGVGDDNGCWECCRDLDCGSATQWDCMGHSCEPMCGGVPC